MFAQANLGRSVAECRIFATKEQLTTYLLGELLKHRKFPPKLVVAALAAKILHSATLRPKFACANIVASLIQFTL